MVASHDTVEQVYQIIKRHVNDSTLENIINDLLQVPGNKSFRDTIRRLAARDAVFIADGNRETR